MNLFKEIIKIIIFFFTYIFQRNTDSQIVYYHDVGRKYTNMGTPLEIIKKHVEILKKSGFSFVPNIVETNYQLKMCFDDGWAGVYEHRDFFVKEKIKPTVFIAVDLIGKDGYLTHSQIIELLNLGFIFQSHTWSHVDLTTISKEELEHELKDTRVELQRRFNQPFDEICYPMGRFSDEVYNESIKAGYNLIYTSLDGGGYFDYLSNKIVCRKFLQSISPLIVKYYVMSRSSFIFKRDIKHHYCGTQCQNYFK